MKKTTFIILAWVLVCCGFSHQSYAQVNQVNPDSNISRVAQTQTTSVRSGITTSNYAFNQDNSGLIVPSNWDNVAGTATRLSTPIANQNRVPVTITHSASQTIGIGSVACGTAGVNAENHYFRDFDLANDFGIAGDFNVTAAEFGVQEATDPVVVTVNIWSSTGVAFPGGTLVLEGTATYTSTPADLGTVVSVPVTATIPAGAVMVFEFVQADGSAWRIGSNDIGQTGVSWILADACGITNPTNGTAIGFPDFHLVMNVVGEEAGGGLVALPVDFELPAGSYDFVGFEGADSVVEANPDMTGNPSATVMRTTKTAGAQFFAGTALNLDTPIDFSTTEMVSMKSWSPKDNIPVRMRLENADNSVGIEMDVNTAVMNGWETLTYDFTGMTGGTDFVRVVVFFEFIVGLAGDGSTYYYDDIQTAQTPPPPPTDCNIYASTAAPFDIDGTETQTADCAVAPNLVPVTVTESGLIGTGVNIDNVTVDIAHTWSADLQLTLVSPSGASLLLANELGGNDDDAYNNTIFMDGGADITMATAPYNAAPFAAEGGAFATAFAGEEVNGDWQLQVCDGAAGDTGTVLAFSLTICSDDVPPPPACVTSTATVVPFDIDGTETQTADCAVAPNLVPVTVAESGLIGTGANIDNVTVDIAHTWSADLQLTLVSPSGASLLLANELGGNDDDAYNNTIFMDGGADITMATAPYNAAPFAAEGGAFATAFAGEEVNGDWQLQVCDGAAGDTGTVLAFSLTICSDDVPPPPACVTSTATVVPFDIDGTETQTADCAVAPNLVPVTVAESGLIGTGANIDNVTVDIAHTWSADLQLTLVSPSGASLLLANELGGNDDDAYNNTIFMDGGADITMATAPYNTAPFAAEGGAFATAFAGEEINGDWQLQVCDGAAGDTGTVLAFSLTICSNAPPPTCMETAATAVPLDIDGAGNVTADCAVAPNLVPVTIAESGIIGTDVVLDFAQIDILHTFSADLDLFLVSPLGTELLLSDDNGGGTDDGYNMTQFSDGGADITAATAPFGTGPYAAEGGSFAVAFNGEEINGDWQLKVCDDAGGDTGSVQAFSLQFCPPPTCPEVINIVVTPTLTDAAISWDAQAAATNGYIVDVFADGADPMTATPVYNEILAAGTTMTTATGLMASTSYDLYVTSDCGASGLSSVNPVDFTTLIAPPACGGKFYDTGGPDNDFDNNEAYQVNILPDNAGDLVTASFVFVDTGGGGFDILLVDIGDGTGFQQVPEVAMGDTPVVFTSAAADGSLLFDFFSSGVVPNPGWDADITCNPPPACPSPSGFIVDNITATTADLSWNEVANASNGYIASVFNAGDDPLTATPVYTEMVASGTTMTVATGLMQTTSYDAYIQADCDADGFSLTDMVSFNTLQEPPACGNEFFDTGGTDNPYQNNEDISFLIVADSPDNIITLDFTFVEIEDNFDFLRVFDGDDATAPELSDAVLGVQNIGQIASTIPGGNLFVTFTSDGSVTQGGWAANVICVPPPPCPTPTGINLSNVMAESVDISWNAVAEAINGYRVAVFATGDDPTTDTPAFAEDTMMLMSTATGLTNNTTYDLYIVSLCDNMVTSGLIPIISFTTDVLGLDDAAVEGFTYFPNPSSDVLNLSATNNIDTVSIYNLLGQVVLSQKVNATSSQLNISEFSTGSYIMKVTSNGVTGSYKVIKR
ncbi:MAG: subtilisin-like proprotein convertase family protein [Patiriisocius sp.]|jgi:subtilisin-like proprotein convertase family protein